MTYLVVLNADPGRAAAIIAEIKSVGEWAELGAFSYLLDSALSAGNILERFQPMLGQEDDLWVITATAPWSGYGAVLIDDALQTRLGPAEDYVPKDWDETTQSRP